MWHQTAQIVYKVTSRSRQIAHKCLTISHRFDEHSQYFCYGAIALNINGERLRLFFRTICTYLKVMLSSRWHINKTFRPKYYSL